VIESLEYGQPTYSALVHLVWLVLLLGLTVSLPAPKKPLLLGEPNRAASLARRQWWRTPQRAKPPPPEPPAPLHRSLYRWASDHRLALIEVARIVLSLCLVRRCVQIGPSVLESVCRWQPRALGNAVALQRLPTGELEFSWVEPGDGYRDRWRRLAVLQCEQKASAERGPTERGPASPGRAASRDGPQSPRQSAQSPLPFRCCGSEALGPRKLTRCSLRVGTVTAQCIVGDVSPDAPVLCVMLEVAARPEASPASVRERVAAVSSAASGAGLLTFLVPYDSFSAVATLLRLVDGPSFEPNARPRLQRWMALLPRGLYSSRLREGLAFLLSVVVPSASLVWSPRHCAEAHSRRQRHTSQPSPAPQP